MRNKNRHVASGRGCTHESVVTTRNHGIERRVCEKCGFVSVQLMDSEAAGSELIGTVHQER